MKKTPVKQKAEDETPQMDDVLKRMLSSPPQPHIKKKPAGKPAQQKPTK